MDKYLIVIVGPTAVGKTDLAIKLAQEFGIEIISADSRQFFKEMNIGTAKPTIEELKTVPHHFINSHSITEDFNVGDFEAVVLALLEKLFKNYNAAILTGGSGLYIKAVTDGFDVLPPLNIKIRNQLNALYNQEGLESIQKQLKVLDRDYYGQVDIKNPQRIIRALEI